MSIMFHSIDTGNFTKYNGFNFTETSYWDSPFAESFWYSPNTTMLFATPTYVLGQESPEEIVLRLQPEKLILRNMQPTVSIFGVPISFEDFIMQQIIWSPSENTDINYNMKMKPDYAGTMTIGVLLRFDFTQRVFTINFFTLFDIMTILGGFKSFFGPLPELFSPILVLLFLMQLSNIIRTNLQKSFEDEAKNLLTLSE